MKNAGNLISTCIGVAALTALLTCSHYKNDNPFDVLYPDANYVLKAQWKKLPDTLYLDTAYALPCTTGIGRDAFSSLTIDNIDTDFIDKSKTHSPPFDTVTLWFKKAHIGKVHIVGLRPNGKVNADSSGELIVVNQFKPVINAPKTDTVVRGPDTIKVGVLNTTDSIVTVYWRLFSASSLDSLRDTIYNDSVRFFVNTTGSGLNDTLFIWARNSLDSVSDTVKTALAISGIIPDLRGLNLPDTISCGDILHFTVKLGTVTDSWFKVALESDDGRYKDTSANYRYAGALTVDMLHPCIDTGMVRFSIQLIDSTGITMLKKTRDSCFIRYTLPALYIQPLLVVPINRQYPITVTDRNSVAVRYIWNFASGNGASDTTSASFITKKYQADATDTVRVSGVNKYGFKSTPVTAIIVAKALKYIISTNDSLFPSIVTAHRIDTFGVTVDSASLLTANLGVYSWRVDSSNVTLVNREDRQLSRLPQYFADSGTYQVSVIVRDSSGDSSNRITKLVVAHRYAPLCKFLKSIDTTAINQFDSLRLHYWDTNPDSSGKIVRVYWDLDGKGTGGDSVLSVKYSVPGVYIIRANVADNDGFLSPLDSMRLVVISSVPYIDSLPQDMTVYINTLLKMQVTFHPGANGDSISYNRWILSGSKNLDTMTVKSNTLSVLFDSAGVDTVIVNCGDTRGFTPANPVTFKVIVVENTRPIAAGMKPDTAWQNHDTAFVINTVTIKPEVPITEYYVSWNVSGPFDKLTTSSVHHAFTSSGMKYVRIFVVDAQGTASETVTDSIMVRIGKPVIDSIAVNAALTSLFVAKPQNYSVWARDTNGLIDSIKVFWKNSDSSLVKSNSPFIHAFGVADTGTQTIKAMVKDNDGFWSDTVGKQVYVRLGKPLVKSFRADSAVFFKTKRRFTISASDSAGRIDTFFVSINNGAVKKLTDSTFDTVFTSPGKYGVKINVKNDRKMLSDPLYDTIVVNAPKPLFRGIAIDTLSNSVFVFDARAFTIKAQSAAAPIDSVKVAWNGSLIFTETKPAAGDSAKFIHTFAISDTAVKSIRVRVVDTFSQTTDTVVPVAVRLGKPVADGLTPLKQWVNRDTMFTIAAHDTNGKVDSVMINWGDGTGIFRKACADTIRHKYVVAQTGIKTIRIFVKDNDGIYSDTVVLSDTALLGKPRITAFASDTPTARIFFNDSIPFRVSGIDTNGTVDSISVDYGTGIFGPFLKFTGSPYKFIRLFAKADTGQTTMQARIKDNDGVVSDTASLTFFVQLGTPVLKRVPNNDTMLWVSDTLVCPYIPSSHISTVAVTPFDTNGSIVRFYWDISNGGLTDTNSSPIFGPTGGSPDGHFLLKVTGKDDDSLISNTVQFYFSPHQPPPVVSSNTGRAGAAQVLFWSGKDAVDQLSTLYKIVIKKGGELAPGDDNNSVYIVQDFKPGSQYTNAAPSFDYSFVYTPPSSGTYYYQIIARNSRGQMSRLTGLPNFFY